MLVYRWQIKRSKEWKTICDNFSDLAKPYIIPVLQPEGLKSLYYSMDISFLSLRFLRTSVTVFSIWIAIFRIDKFRNYLNRQHENIRFTSETENENSISLLHIKISRGNNKFTTSVDCKLAFSGVFTNFGSFIRSHIITTCCLPYYTGHSNFALILNFFIRKLASERLVLKITVIPKVFLLISVLKST